MSLQYELGLRGRPEDVADFSDKMREGENYWYHSVDEETDKCLVRYGWNQSEDPTLAKVKHWTRYWSNQYPNSEAYYYLKEETRTYAGDRAKIEHGSYINNDEVTAGVIDSHASYVAHFGEKRKCECEGRTVKRNPLWAPFEDCPPRLDPPREWAIENIMEASDMIGRR